MCAFPAGSALSWPYALLALLWGMLGLSSSVVLYRQCALLALIWGISELSGSKLLSKTDVPLSSHDTQRWMV